LAANYVQGVDRRVRAGKIARYAWGADYHKIMLQNMEPIDAFLREQGGTQKCYVDTGPIPVEFRSAIHDRIYGCDDCLEVCPWNRFAKETQELRFHLPDPLKPLTLRQLAMLTDDEFRTLFRESPIKRIKRPRFVRNICVALGNIGTGQDLPVLTTLSEDPDPLIAEHALWAAEQIQNRTLSPALHS